MRQTRDRRRADRTRAAICIALADAKSPLTIADLVVAVTRLGVPLGPRPNKVIADAVRWEVARHHVRRTARGAYAVDKLPPSTLRYMRVRVRLYAADPSQSYSRPDAYPRYPASNEPDL